MKSIISTTFELDDANEAVKELSEPIKSNPKLCKNSIGILLCDADMDVASVSKQLSSELGFDVAGMTTLAVFDPSGYQHSAAVLTVFTADDCTFTAAASNTLTADNYNAEITDTYNSTIPDNSPEDYRAAVLFAFCPNNISFSADKYPEVLSDITGSVPVIGGVASDDYEYVSARVFLSGNEYKDSMVLVNVSGNVKPLFSIRHVTSQFAERIRRITDAKDNVVYKVGDETFVKYLEGFGLKTEVPDVLLAFNPYPMMLTQDGNDEVPLMRHITGLDIENGSGSCVGDVPIGSMANICLLKKEDLISSSRDSMQALLDTANQQEGYEYSTIFSISCCGRALLLGTDSDAEGNVLTEILPENIGLSGAYCFGEICPTRFENGKANNRFHNCSITFCMM